MKNGYIERRVIKCLIIGAAGVGKTLIKHLLLNNELPQKRMSTGVLENPTVAVSLRDVSNTRASISTDGLWNVVHNDEDLIKMIAKMIKSEAHNQKPQETSPATKIVNTDEHQVKSTGTAFESSEVHSAENLEDSIQKECIDAIIEAEGM